MNRAAHARAMRQLRVFVRVLSAMLLALIAHCVIDGANLAVLIGGVLIALLLLVSGALWRYGLRVEPRASAPAAARPHARRDKQIGVADRHTSSKRNNQTPAGSSRTEAP
jgi:hypothetical protein